MSDPTTISTVAFVGLGRMGLPMASNLLKAGFAVVGCDLDPAKGAALAERGGRVAPSPAAAAADSDLTLSLVMDDAALRSVAGGVLDGARPGHVFCDLSTVSPTASRETADRARGAGLGFVGAALLLRLRLANTRQVEP